MKSMRIFRFLALCALAIPLISCNEDPDLLSDADMFAKLSRGSGIWNIAEIRDETISNTGEVTVDSVQTDLPGYYQFYLRALDLGVGFGDFPTALIAVGPEENHRIFEYILIIEPTRAIFETEAGSRVETYTIVENGREKQVWERYRVNSNNTINKRSITLRFCSLCRPYVLKSINTEG
jgi:hypothetical protein